MVSRVTAYRQIYGTDKQAWELENAANLDEGRRERLLALAKEEETGQLAGWLRLAAGDVGQWSELCKWQKQMDERDERLRRLNPTDAFIFSEIARFQQKDAKNPPAETALLASLRQIGEMRLSVTTDPLPEQDAA